MRLQPPHPFGARGFNGICDRWKRVGLVSDPARKAGRVGFRLRLEPVLARAGSEWAGQFGRFAVRCRKVRFAGLPH